MNTRLLNTTIVSQRNTATTALTYTNALPPSSHREILLLLLSHIRMLYVSIPYRKMLIEMNRLLGLTSYMRMLSSSPSSHREILLLLLSHIRMLYVSIPYRKMLIEMNRLLGLTSYMRMLSSSQLSLCHL